MYHPLALSCPVQHYAWGSTDGIARITGESDPEGRPTAELWMGAHPLAPCYADRSALPDLAHNDGTSLLSLAELIVLKPGEMLGEKTRLRYGADLPFLFKILSAARPLSLQVHPNRDQARSGFARESAAGIPQGSAKRNYRDQNGKAEMVLALTPFTCLCGFRGVSEALSLLSEIPCEALAPALSYLENARDYRGFLSSLYSLPDTDKRAIAHAVRRVASGKPDRQGPLGHVSLLCEHYPDDIGILAPLYLNSITLSPGEALYLDPRVPHTYLAGTALELMSNSDNVIRGGLTAKEVNHREFLDVLDPSPFEPRILRATADSARLGRYITPAADFELSLVQLSSSSVEIPTGVPSILLVTEGCVTLMCKHGSDWSTEAQSGSVHFFPAASPPVVAAGTCTAYLASLPRDSGTEP